MCLSLLVLSRNWPYISTLHRLVEHAKAVDESQVDPVAG